jgi:hypothetical protein
VLLFIPLVSTAQTVTFTEVSAAAGITEWSNGEGVAWGDYDGDGWVDLLVPNWRSPHVLYRNLGGTFANVAGTVPSLSDPSWGAVEGASWGDYDNDGDLDIYMVSRTWPGQEFESRVLENDGAGGFSVPDIGPASIALESNWTGPWVDYDNDGFLDIFRGGYLLRGHGGTFTDETLTPMNKGAAATIAWGDYDNDGDMDVFQGRWCCTDFMYENEGCGSFSWSPLGPYITVSPGDGAWGTEWGDYDNDGFLDLMFFVHNNEVRLFRNDGADSLVDVTAATPLNDNVEGKPWDFTWLDYDNDGDLDIFILVSNSANKLFRNDGGGVWVEDTDAGLNETGMQGTVATADYDNDGDLDIYVSGGGGVNKLYRNDLDNGNHWLHVDLVGTISNRSAIGARVTVVSGGISQIREVTGGDNSQNSLTVEFGLGAATSVDNVIVRWPSGIVQELGPISTVDQVLTVTESGSAPPTVICEFARVVGGPEYNTGIRGGLWGDYDNDGDEDLFALGSNRSPSYFLRLFNNDGTGALTDVTPPELQAETDGDVAAGAWIDYDNDGDLDLHHTIWQKADRLFENDGAGGFTNVASAANIDVERGSINSLWADYDHDGWVDCFVPCHGGPFLSRNKGDGTFEYVTSPISTTGSWQSGAAWGDYNNDGYIDLFAADDTWPTLDPGNNRLFRNLGGGNFDEPLDPTHPLVLVPCPISACSWGDYDNDGYLDLVMTGREGTSLFHNEGSDDFTDVTPAVMSDPAIDVLWADYDNDGDLDLYVTRGTWAGYPHPPEFAKNALYRNLGNGTFEDATVGPLENPTGGGGAAWADIDNDGDLDLYMSTHGWNPTRLLENIVPYGNHWLQVKLVGTVSNVAAIGTRVTATAGGMTMIREVSGGSGVGGHCSHRAAFGLGGAIVVDELTIRWPSGIVQTLTDVAANQILTIEEPTLRGTVTAAGSPIGGVTVDLYSEPDHILLDSKITDLADGTYEFVAPLGDCTVELVLPLGYGPVTPLAQPATITRTMGDWFTLDFELEQMIAVGNARSKGYWKHQYKVHERGKGHAHESEADLASYRQAIFDHFYSRTDEYAIQIESVTHSGGGTLSDDDALAKLSARGSAGTTVKAEQQFLALLHNVVSGKVSTYYEASEDGATVSQVITYVADLLEDGDPSNDEVAKDIAEMVNHNEPMEPGVIPPDVPQVAYRRGATAVAVGPTYAHPNPSTGITVISYSVPAQGERVVLEVYDVTGRRVRTLVSGHQSGGVHRAAWRGDDERSHPVAAGVYFYRLERGDMAETGRIVLLR